MLTDEQWVAPARLVGIEVPRLHRMIRRALADPTFELWAELAYDAAKQAAHAAFTTGRVQRGE